MDAAATPIAGPARRSLALVRAAIQRFAALHGRQPEAGVNVAGYFTRAHAARAGAVTVGWLAEDGDALRLTAAGLAAAAPCASCGAEGRCPCRKPRRAPRRRADRAVVAAPAVQDAAAARVEAPAVEVQASDLTIVLERLPPGEGRATMTGVRRRQGELYRQRAQRSLAWAVQRWERTHCRPIEEGADLSRHLEGRVRYWTTGATAGWISIQGSPGRGGDAGCRPECAVRATAEGIEAARAYVPPAPPAPVAFACCAALRGPADHGHGAACPATAPALGAAA